MPDVSEQLSDQFNRWDARSRGHLVYPHPVPPEPPFVPFRGYALSGTVLPDDGRRPTLISSLLQSFWTKPRPLPPALPEEEPVPELLERRLSVEFPLRLPEGLDPNPEEFEAFTRSLFVCQEPIAFELFGSAAAVTAQLAVSPSDYGHVQQQLQAFFPDVVATPTAEGLPKAWDQAGAEAGVVEFGLARETVAMLATAEQDPFVALVGALSELEEHECGVFQVIWQPAERPWAESLIRSVTDPRGEPFFVDAPELADFARKKTALPLYSAVVRLAVTTADYERTWTILRRLAGALRVFANPAGNELIPLRNDEYPYTAHVADVLLRQSRRVGMLLNADELIGFVHLPGAAVRSPKFRRLTKKTKAAPPFLTAPGGLLLGLNEHAGQLREVRLSAEQRVRHLHLVGASGTGKSTLLFNLIRQDIEAGAGVGVLDPHGDLIDQLLGIIPEHRIQDVVLIDPGDEAFSIGFNILSAHSDWEKNLLASDLVSVFRRLSTSWGDQMDRVLANAILAFLESSTGGTLLELRNFLIEPAFRKKFLTTVRDSEVVYYWEKGFAQLSGNKSVGPVLTRLETFLAPKPIRYMVAQRTNRLDFGDILDSGKIFLAKLSQGALGKDNSHLLGSLFVAKFQQTAMSRQRQAADSRRDFWLYLDEFQDFMTPSMAEMLAGTRKYRLGLALAHQEMRQVQRDADVAGAIANAGTQIYFRVGDQDARALAHGLTSFDARDLQNLGTGEAICRVERSDCDFNLAVVAPTRPADDEAARRRAQVATASREKYATPRDEIEAWLRSQQAAARDNRPEPKAKEQVAAPKPPAPPPGPEKTTPEPPAPRAGAEPEVISEPERKPASEPPPIVVNRVSQPTSELLPPGNQPAEIQKTEVAPGAVPTRPTVETSEWGRGGKQHAAVLRRVKAAAMEMGFRVAIDEAVPGMAGGVDLILSRGGLAIACEVTITNPIDYEVGNVEKCANAGFAQIAVIGIAEEKLRRMETAVRQSLGADVAARVAYYLPDDFIAHVKALPPPAMPEPTERKIRGYRVKGSYAQLSPEDARAREAATIDALVELMRRKPKG
jgi:hypothetical protein